MQVEMICGADAASQIFREKQWAGRVAVKKRKRGCNTFSSDMQPYKSETYTDTNLNDSCSKPESLFQELLVMFKKAV